MTLSRRQKTLVRRCVRVNARALLLDPSRVRVLTSDDPSKINEVCVQVETSGEWNLVLCIQGWPVTEALTNAIATARSHARSRRAHEACERRARRVIARTPARAFR